MNPNNPINKQSNQQLILIALSDGKWHRNMELIERTKLTPRTLSKHLRELERELRWIERREDTETAEYPHPVLYKATDTTVRYMKLVKITSEYADNIETMLKQTKDPFPILDEILKISKTYFIMILAGIQYSKHMPWKHIDYMTTLLLHSPYKIYTTTLIKATTKAMQSGTHFDTIDQWYKQVIQDAQPEDFL
jgi:DNA-binding HxlR family transcriptional regulator